MTESEEPQALIVFAGVASATGGSSGETDPDEDEDDNGVDI